VKVKIGQIVKRGDPIGNIGLTGQTSGPHVHFTVGYKNANFDNVNLSPIFMSPRNHVIPISYLSILTMDGIIKEGVKNKTPGSALNPAQTP
jgi:murein DD-endopeptidase MepM/ murein hydrolase activator NlpD